ncbi:serine-type D-Ala-D-Ala carboxypeptidase [Algoriphagus sp. oki45]|uniref:D-alanyl-D-alanine carboxypeptidase n=1 Tax=Algoriphagus sp. oki45 TaxID=3067294 RepID=UPI0027F20F7F|nr:serine-type D-Ala-D-Ala carboxypeptidase [Algoriphagus sp. oki45]
MRIKALFFLAWFITSLPAAAQLSRAQFSSLENILGEKSTFSSHMTGFVLYDLDSQRVVYEKNSQLNFIPASTAKLFTLFAAVAILQDSTQTVRYLPAGDTLKIWGSGDPSWKYQDFYQPNFEKIWKNYRVIQFSDANQISPAFGYGWQWDDYYYDYSAERSPLPIYGNLLEVKKVGNRPEVFPYRFQKSIATTTLPINELERDFHSNSFRYNSETFQGRERYIPLLTSGQLTAELAQELTGKTWIYKKEAMPENTTIFRGAPLFPLLQEMMLESDNFIAEQMIWMVSDRLFQTLDTDRAIEYIQKTYFFDLPDQPKWVDGSGLSRHNLFTPRSMVVLIDKLYRIVPEDQLYALLPTGGKTGTLRNTFQAAQPYIFAKSGSMSNHYSLAGLVRTKSGKIYAFAFMNSNFLGRASSIRTEVEKVMALVRDIL